MAVSMADLDLVQNEGEPATPLRAWASSVHLPMDVSKEAYRISNKQEWHLDSNR